MALHERSKQYMMMLQNPMKTSIKIYFHQSLYMAKIPYISAV